MEEVRLVEIHANSWRKSDALPLNLYQWFFQTLNNPVKLGPLRQGNREVIVTKVQGEFSSIEMQKDKSSVIKKVKGSKKGLNRAGKMKNGKREISMLLNSRSSVSLSFATYRMCFVLDVSRSTFTLRGDFLFPFTVLCGGLIAMIQQLSGTLKASKIVQCISISVVAATGIVGEPVISIWEGELAAEANASALAPTLRERLSDLEAQLYAENCSRGSGLPSSSFPSVATMLTSANEQLGKMPLSAAPVIVLFTSGNVDVKHEPCRQLLLEHGAVLHCVVDNKDQSRLGHQMGFSTDLTGLKMLVEAVPLGTITAISNYVDEKDKEIDINIVMRALCESPRFLQRPVLCTDMDYHDNYSAMQYSRFVSIDSKKALGGLEGVCHSEGLTGTTGAGLPRDR